MEPATQTIRHDSVDDMQAETSMALIPASRKKRIESLAPDVWAHAAAVVREENYYFIVPGCLDLDVDDTAFAVGKRVRDRIEKKVGQHLPVRAGITVHRQTGLAFDVKGEIFLFHARSQAHHDLLG
jgi:hypothetical protein